MAHHFLHHRLRSPTLARSRQEEQGSVGDIPLHKGDPYQVGGLQRRDCSLGGVERE